MEGQKSNSNSSDNISLNDKGTEDIMLGMDHTKLDVALKFLTDPKVKKTGKLKQETFLKNKGFSDSEIQLAFDRLSAIDNDKTVDNSWSLFDYIKSVIFGAGMLTAANLAYKSYILPYAIETNDDQRIENLIESFQSIKDDIKQQTHELTGTLKQMQSLMEENQKHLTVINTELKKDTSGPSSIAELKVELSTIKSMMLSRTQFPATPYSAVYETTNEIPAWQRLSKESYIDKNN